MKKSTLKAQLFSAIAMMLVATVALGTSTYAWFVNNTEVSVEQMNFTASTARSLEIGVRPAINGTVLDADFSSVLTSAKIEAANANYIAEVLKPTSGVLAVGNVAALPAFYTDESAGWITHTDGKQYATTFVTAKMAAATPDMTVVPLSFRSSEDMKVYLKDVANIFTSPIKSAFADITEAEKIVIRAALDLAVDAEVGQANYNDAVAKLNAQLALINKSVRIAFVDSARASVIESNPATTGARRLTTLVDSEDDTTNKNDKAEHPITSGNIIETVSAQKLITKTQPAVLVTPATFNHGVADITTIDGFIDAAAKNTFLFEVEADTVKDVTVYIWLEGCDEDCLSAIASYQFAVNLDFVGGEEVA